MFTPSPAESSSHSHHTTPSPGAVSLSPIPYLPRNQPIVKKPRKRKGKIVNVLRQQYAFDADDDEQDEKQLVAFNSALSIGPSSTLAKVQRAQLAAGLEHHLISLAWETIAQMNFPLWADLKSALDRLKINLATQRTDPATNAQVQCLVALGARKSPHSMITGTDIHTEFARRGDVVQLGLGLRRESVCMQLVDRAIDFSEEQGYFSHHSQDSVDSLALLRMLLNASAPRHRALIPLVHAAGRNYRAGISSVTEASSLIASDAGCALFFGTPLTVSDDELRLFGWPEVNIDQMKETLNATGPGARLEEESMISLRQFVIASMRRLAQYRSKGWSDDEHNSLPLPARAIFDDTFSISEALENAVTSLQMYPSKLCPPMMRTLSRSNHLVKLPIFFHSATISLARDCVAAGMDPDAELYLTEAQTRYCGWFRQFTISLDWAHDDSIEVLSSSVLVEGLEFLPGWMDLVVEAARQSADQSGPLAAAGLTWEHLRQFQQILRISSTVFASSDVHEQELSRQLEMLDLAGGAGARQPSEDPVAAKMLQDALMEMLMD